MVLFLKKLRFYFFFAGFFSLFINILNLTLPIHMLLVYDKVLHNYSLPTLAVVTIGAFVCISIQEFLDFLRSRLLVRASVDLDNVTTEPLISSMLQGSSRRLQPEVYTTGLQDLSLLKNTLTGSAIFSAFDAPFFPVYLAIVFVLHPLLGIITSIGAVILIVLGIVADKSSRTLLNEADKASTTASKISSLCIQNASAVRSMSMMSGLKARWKWLHLSAVRRHALASKRLNFVGSIAKCIRQLLQVAIYGFGAYLVLQNMNTSGIMIAASIIAGRALQPIEMAQASWRQFSDAWRAYRRLDASLMQREAANCNVLPVTGHIECVDVSFKHGDSVILKDVSFSLAAGESMAIIGPSGAGKSTLCRILLGLWQPSTGKILLDGNNLSTWDINSLGKQMGYVPQNVRLFAGTIGENIARLGEADPTKVVVASQIAGAHEMILQFPGGYDMPIPPGGGGLSGGQRQRVGFARALYGGPKCLILDEPNSNLDEAGDAALLQAMQGLKGYTTVVAVTHKPSLLAHVDKILVLRDGRVITFGPAQDVLQKVMPARPVPASNDNQVAHLRRV